MHDSDKFNNNLRSCTIIKLRIYIFGQSAGIKTCRRISFNVICIPIIIIFIYTDLFTIVTIKIVNCHLEFVII